MTDLLPQPSMSQNPNQAVYLHQRILAETKMTKTARQQAYVSEFAYLLLLLPLCDDFLSR